jgi:glycosyltransferase involved in cell wall biosynthesis
MPRPADLASVEPEVVEQALEVARRQRVALFVVAYNAEREIEQTLRRIPELLIPHLADLYVVDDSSQDATSNVARKLAVELPALNVYRTPYNQGYGGNQKLGYRYAIEKGYDVVVLLHGDGQYAPEVLPNMLAPFADSGVDAVFGSRMMVSGAARRGGMPVYKLAGNHILSWLQNRLLGTHLSEFHSGYRAYKVDTLAGLPFEHNTNDFHFDTEIIIQLLLAGRCIVEVPIPTYYGDEICRVNGLAYAWHCMESVLQSRANQLYLLYHPKFDVTGQTEPYRFKRAPTSLHQSVLTEPVKPGTRVVDLGAGRGEVGLGFHEQGARVVAVDRMQPPSPLPYPFLTCDLDLPFADAVVERLGGHADLVIALDVLEHMAHPERMLDQIRRLMVPGGRLLASTGNVAYLPLRLSLAAGQFNYGKRGILDLTHRRLFTLSSFARMLRGGGFRVDGRRGFGPPLVDMVGDSGALRLLDSLLARLARLRPSLFAYQYMLEATRLDEVGDLLARTVDAAAPDDPNHSGGSARRQ